MDAFGIYGFGCFGHAHGAGWKWLAMADWRCPGAMAWLPRWLHAPLAMPKNWFQGSLRLYVFNFSLEPFPKTAENGC